MSQPQSLSRPLTTCIISLGCLLNVGPAQAAYNFQIDTFALWKNFDPTTLTSPGALLTTVPIYYDNFADLNGPPSAPNYLNGNSASYILHGGMGPEAIVGGAGIVNLNSADALPNVWGTPLQQAILTIDTNPANLAGLKQGNSSFAVGGIFNFANPGTTGGSYGVRLTDAGLSNGDDIISLSIKGRGDGAAVLDFCAYDNNTNVCTLIDRQVLQINHEQIALALGYMDPDGIGPLAKSVYGAYFYLDNDVPSSLYGMQGNADIFHGEVFTRAAFFAADTSPVPVPEPAEYALMLAGLGLVGWRAHNRRS